MIKKIFNQRGFTLIELLAVMIVLVSIGSIVVAILFSTIKGANRSNATERIVSSGNYVVESLSRDLRFATGFFGISTDGATFDKDICSAPLSPTPTPAPTPDFTSYKYIKLYDQNRDEITYSCNQGFNKITPSDTLSLINDNDLLVTSCYFSCFQDFPTDPPSIGIIFSLKDKNSLIEIPFQTSITMRNINK